MVKTRAISSRGWTDRSVRRAILIALVALCGPLAVLTPAGATTLSDLDEHAALLIIDIQDFYFPEGALPLVEPELASANAKLLLDRFREAGREVIHVGHNAQSGVEFHPDVAPRESEKIFMKDDVSAFEGTGLQAYLQDKGIQKLVICGMQTHMCVEGATRAAHDLGYDCIVVADACATRDLEFGGRAVAAADVQAATLATLDRFYAEVVDTEGFLGPGR
jgi:nicotinamidase-related amidase